MDTASDVLQQTIGVLVLVWVVGYTILRTQEALARDPGSDGDPGSEGSAPAAQARKGSFDHAQQRRRARKLDAPLWGLVAAVNAARKAVKRRRAAPGDAAEDKRRGKRDEERGGRDWRPYDEDTTGRERRQGDPRDPHGDEPHRRRDHDHRRDDADPPDITVEQVPRYGPRHPELDRPIRALDPPGEPGTPAVPIAPEGPPPANNTPDGRTEIEMGGRSVALPGSGGVAPLTGNGDSHDDAVDLARKIVRAMAMTQDPVDSAVQMVKVTLEACWAHLDRLRDAGIGGSVLDGWMEAVMAYEAVYTTAKTLQAQQAEAQAAAAQAKRRQASHGDRVQEAVTANPSSTANHTSYYGKQ